jgi:hypothetical protein
MKLRAVRHRFAAADGVLATRSVILNDPRGDANRQFDYLVDNGTVVDGNQSNFRREIMLVHARARSY